MKSPIPPCATERESAVNRFAVPTARIFAAAVILITGAGVAAVFWKMPKANETHALYDEGVVDQELASFLSPDEAVAAISPEEMQQMSLPMLEIAPVSADGAGKYAQIYPVPAPLAMANAEQVKAVPKEEPVFPSAAPQKFEPMREIIEEKPISVEPVRRDFAPMPTTANTIERSDELLAMFHFVENSRIDLNSPSGQPSDPFPVQAADPFPVAATPALPALPHLQPLQLEGLSPLFPLQKIDLQPFAVQLNPVN